MVAVGGGCGIFVGGDARRVGRGVHGAPGGAEEVDAKVDAEEDEQDRPEDLKAEDEPECKGAVFATVALAAIVDLLLSPCPPGEVGAEEAEDEAHEDACEFVGHHGRRGRGAVVVVLCKGTYRGLGG